jgi:hypothetical protein
MMMLPNQRSTPGQAVQLHRINNFKARTTKPADLL